jgi:hypothetical protein
MARRVGAPLRARYAAAAPTAMLESAPRPGSASLPGRARELLDTLTSKHRKGSAGGVPQSPAAFAGVLRGAIVRIDWDDDPDALRRGDLASLPQDATAAIERAAQLPAIVALAHALQLDAVVVVIALMAKAAGTASRSAQRIARLLLAADQAAVTAAMAEAGL